MHTALYRAYRPNTFSEIWGQEHIVKILRNQVEADAASHAYLFCGTRGTGKTTMARILAKGVNCLAEESRPCGVCADCEAIRRGVFADVIEIDAASHNGVENIRELRESVKYPPAAGRKKVYIIDEVHMLSSGAFNALLKTLEEPPDNVIFILATTEPQKLPTTILSRCMRLDFRRVPEKLLKGGLEKICGDLGATVSEAALKLIALNADGSVRDGISLLEQCLAAGENNVSREDVLMLLGASGEAVFAELTDHVAAGRVDEALLLFDRNLADGRDARQFMKDWLAHYRNLLIAKFVGDPEDILNLSSENAEKVKAQSEGLSLAEINRAIVEISSMAAEARWSVQPRILAELCIVHLAAKEKIAEAGAAPVSTKPATGAAPAKAAQANPPAASAEQTTSDAKAPASGREPPNAAPPESTRSKSADAASAGAAPPELTSATPAGEKPASEKPAGTKKAAIAEAPAPDYSRLWESLFQGADGLSGSLQVARTGVVISAVSETECVVLIQSEAAESVIEKNRLYIEEVLEKRLGHRRTLKCVREKEPTSKTAARPLEELAEEVANKLGIPTQIDRG